ncbi:MAG: hypothetical protein Kow0067_07100 [Coriobacteriia bacterium]
MNVLLLGPHSPVVEDAIRGAGDVVTRTEDPICRGDAILSDTDFIVSYGFRHIIPADVLERFGQRAVNLHISLLPWNRGADPNLWSFLENTPKGVTIHVLDAGIDTGPILLQRSVVPTRGDTLRTSYERLNQEIASLFADNWSQLRECRVTPVAQAGPGTSHRSGDKQQYMHLLTDGWDTPVAGLVGRAL